MPKLLRSFLLVFCIAVLMGMQCSKYELAVPPDHDFWEKVDLYPAGNVYNTGDTIWLRFATNDKTLFDSLAHQRLYSGAASFLFGVTLAPKYGAPENLADAFCNFINPASLPVNYFASQSGTTVSCDIQCDNTTSYDVQIGVIPKYPGIYVLDLPDAIMMDTCPGQTNPYPNSFLHFTYNLSDCNKDVYLSIPPQYRQEIPEGFTESRIDLKVSYAFQVQ